MALAFIPLPNVDYYDVLFILLLLNNILLCLYMYYMFILYIILKYTNKMFLEIYNVLYYYYTFDSICTPANFVHLPITYTHSTAHRSDFIFKTCVCHAYTMAT
jgi:hypothetical protein